MYLHYALELWFVQRVQPSCRGSARIIRFADDYAALFANQTDAQRFAANLPERLAKFGLSLAEEKTKLLALERTLCDRLSRIRMNYTTQFRKVSHTA